MTSVDVHWSLTARKSTHASNPGQRPRVCIGIGYRFAQEPRPVNVGNPGERSAHENIVLSLIVLKFLAFRKNILKKKTSWIIYFDVLFTAKTIVSKLHYNFQTLFLENCSTWNQINSPVECSNLYMEDFKDTSSSGVRHPDLVLPHLVANFLFKEYL